MKQIRIFGFVLLVAILALPLDAVACDDLEAKRDVAQKALDDANEELKKVVRTALALLFPTTTVPGPSKPGEDPPDDVSSGLAAGLIAKGLDPKVDAARAKRDKAQTDLDTAQNALDVCEKQEKRSCG